MTLPNFLLIGALKSGTTTLYEDLIQSQDIYMPPDKEPGGLLWCVDQRGVEKYKRCFSTHSGEPLIGDASTIYAKSPEYSEAPGLARRVLGENLKIIYIVRDPVSRMISEYKHLYAGQEEHLPIERALFEHSRYINYSRYAYQLSAWRKYFSEKNILILKFENYVKKRDVTIRRVCEFLGADYDKVKWDYSGRANQGTSRRVPKGFVRRFARSRLYLYRIKPHLPKYLQTLGKTALATAAGKEVVVTLPEYLREELMGRMSDADLKVWYDAI